MPNNLATFSDKRGATVATYDEATFTLTYTRPPKANEVAEIMAVIKPIEEVDVLGYLNQPRRRVDIENRFSVPIFRRWESDSRVKSAELWCVNSTRFKAATHYFAATVTPPNPVNIPFGDSLKDWRGSKDLAQEYGVQVQSINNDLKKLETLGIVERSYQWIELPTTAFNMRIWRFVPNITIPPFVERNSYAHTTHKVKAARKPKQTQVFAPDPLKYVGSDWASRRKRWGITPGFGDLIYRPLDELCLVVLLTKGE